MNTGFGRCVNGLVVRAWVGLLVGSSAGSTLADDNVLAARMAAGPPGNQPVAVDLSAAHALAREFAVDSPFAPSDAALARALAEGEIGDGASLESSLQRYADELSGVVALRASPARLGEARVEWAGGVALIRPGTGRIELPANTALVVVDLRDLPADRALDEILARSIAPALAGPVPRPSRLVRIHRGPVDEVFDPFNTYSTSLYHRDDGVIVGSGSRDLPIVLWVGSRIGPQAASFAAALRAAGRAWIAGDSVPLVVAESTWQAVGSEGLAVRTSLLATHVPQAPLSSSDSVAPGEIYVADVETRPDLNWSISLSGAAGDDLDLYLARDENEDGIVDELVLSSTSSGAEERLEWAGVELGPGRYQVWVYGRFVVSERSAFTLELESSLVLPLPDEIPADLPDAAGPGGNDVRLMERLHGAMPPALSGAAERSRPAPVSPFGFVHPIADGRGELRAGLLIAHGLLRLFYPYFPEVGDRIDERLLETLRAADVYSGADRLAAWRILRRFGEALHDGHQFVGARVNLFETALPVMLEHDAGRPLVRRSMVPEIQPGDAIVALEGRAIQAVYAEELARTSAATLGYRLDIADRYVYEMNGPLSLTLEDTFGVRRDVTVAPQPIDSYFAAVDAVESDRPSGTLAELEAPDFYYFNLNTAATPSDDDALRALAEAGASGSRGMILDMRGYPGGVNHYDIAARLIDGPFTSPEFEFAIWIGPDQRQARVVQNSFEGIGSPSYHGPLILIAGPHSVSAAENFMQMLIGAGRVSAVVGRGSAGTNGNITGLSLPGGFSFTFTGLEVRNPDGSRFHGIGVVPDHAVPIRPEDLRDGSDRALLESIRLLRAAVGP